MTTNPEALVREFHALYDLPVSVEPACLNFDRVDLRVGLISEEYTELVAAIYGETAGRKMGEAITEVLATFSGHPANGDVVETADAMGDLVYVIYGAALEAGIPLTAVLEEIHSSNLSKLGADGKPIYRADGKVLKGPGFTPPNIAAVLNTDAARKAAALAGEPATVAPAAS